MTEKEELFLDIVKLVHECPWYKTIFKPKSVPKYKIIHTNTSGIGTNTILVCKRCGKEYDITDYSCW